LTYHSLLVAVEAAHYRLDQLFPHRLQSRSFFFLLAFHLELSVSGTGDLFQFQLEVLSFECDAAGYLEQHLSFVVGEDLLELAHGRCTSPSRLTSFSLRGEE
jgi:hypothetical protein